MSPKKVRTGLDLLLDKARKQLNNARIGVVCHPASVNAHFQHITEVLKGFDVTRLFGPEHGIWGNAQDMVGVESGLDPVLKRPVVSLYGPDFESLKPKPADLADVDLLIIDLQDIGTRFYTFIYTMAFCMEACAALGKKVIVLDRPNPINGDLMEGALLEKGFESFVGIYPIPIRHGMTIGELALYFNREFNIHCDLTVIPMEGWKRSMHFDDTGLPWVHPSPNMPTLETAIVYPGLCLLEATELSEGRGTTKPFELIGAPFIHPWTLSEQMNRLKLPGITFRPAFFTPTFQKWARQDCGGVFLHVTDRLAFRPVLTGALLVKTIHDLYPQDFKWREKPYEFVSDRPAIDLLWGSTKLREAVERGLDFGDSADLSGFAAKRDFALLY